jgi:hypothetical protein
LKKVKKKPANLSEYTSFTVPKKALYTNRKPSGFHLIFIPAYGIITAQLILSSTNCSIATYIISNTQPCTFTAPNA